MPLEPSFVDAIVLAELAFAAAPLPWPVSGNVFAALAFATAPLPLLVATVYATFRFAAVGLRKHFCSLPKPSVVWPGMTYLPLFTLCVVVFAPALLAPLASRRAPPLREDGISYSLLLSSERNMASGLSYGMPSSSNEAIFGDK